MQIKAITTIIEWDADAHRMVIINAGEMGEASDALAHRLIDDRRATASDGTAPSPLDHDADGAPGGSLPHDPPALSRKSKAELLAIADAEGVAVDDAMNMADLRAAIEAHRDGATAGDGTAPAI